MLKRCVHPARPGFGDRVESALPPVNCGSNRVKPSEVPADKDMNDAGLGDVVSGDEGDPEEFELASPFRFWERRYSFLSGVKLVIASRFGPCRFRLS